MKAIATRLYDGGYRGDKLIHEFVRLIPHWRSYFKNPITDNAIAQRADKARRYENENPETHPQIKNYWDAAGVVVSEGKRLSKKTIRGIVVRVSPRPPRG